MKILRFDDDRIGVLKNENFVIDVSEAVAYRTEKGPQKVIEEIIDSFEIYRSRFEQIAEKKNGVPLAGVKLLAPIPRPSKCLAAFVNYLDRPDRSVESLPNEYFYKAPELVAPEGTVELLDMPAVVVYQAEAELAFVIGKRAKNVKEADAMNYVFGYVPFFDISARGVSRRTQFVPKGQDTYGPCGPWITTKDEIPDPHNVVVRSWVNGKLRQNYNTKYMAHKIPDQIAWLTRFVQLQPGDVIATGTYHEGLGPINDGDLLEIDIEKMGKARFRVKGYGPRKDAEWMPGVSQPKPPPGGGIAKV
ncbi:MAG: fumarylacetoacetate hydrolase family protein [Deltaproteobacteria bacterium]|nr:fumarylacetoacetate hydrolase family protein [Deltaproteobacteria bacterium]